MESTGNPMNPATKRQLAYLWVLIIGGLLAGLLLHGDWQIALTALGGGLMGVLVGVISKNPAQKYQLVYALIIIGISLVLHFVGVGLLMLGLWQVILILIGGGVIGYLIGVFSKS